MNTKNNARRRESVEKIENAFIKLLKTKEINEITVTEICKMTKLNRSTFYANFEDIYFLAEKVKERLEKEVSLLYESDRVNKINSNDYLRLFSHIKDNKDLYITYFKLGYDSKFEVYIYDTYQAEKYFDNKHIDYHIEFFKSGFNAIVKKWLAEGCKESPEEMAEILNTEYRGRA